MRSGFGACAVTLASIVACGAGPMAAIDKPQGIGPALAACWRPPREGDEITLRLSFRRDGTVFGRPRITYMKPVGGLDGEAALANSIYAAIAACAPLRFTPSLGAAIAGRTFLIRFIAPRKEQRAVLSTQLEI